jgi:hypothetical protein
MAVEINPRTARRYLRDITDPSLHFHTSDGRHLKNLIDLFHFLKTCDEASFHYHFNSLENHFSAWLHDVILDHSLAGQIALYREKNPLKFLVLKRINVLVHHATREPKPIEEAKMILEEAQVPEEEFIAKDGTRIRSIHELRVFLEKADEAPFRENVHEAIDWIEAVLLDTRLAHRLRGSQDRQSILDLLSERISHLEFIEAL